MSGNKMFIKFLLHFQSLPWLYCFISCPLQNVMHKAAPIGLFCHITITAGLQVWWTATTILCLSIKILLVLL